MDVPVAANVLGTIGAVSQKQRVPLRFPILTSLTYIL
jgi:hypothetical protein